MTKKDYELIAAAIARGKRQSINCYDSEETLDLVIKSICNELKLDNPRFDKNKFVEACKA